MLFFLSINEPDSVGPEALLTSDTSPGNNLLSISNTVVYIFVLSTMSNALIKLFYLTTISVEPDYNLFYENDGIEPKSSVSFYRRLPPM
jgi:hypothetical protein